MSNRFDDRNDLSETDKELRWDKIHSRGGTRDDIRNQYDGWLEQDNRIIDLLERCNSPILDLGCGIGIDTLHLVENGHQVVACDFSKEALENFFDSEHWEIIYMSEGERNSDRIKTVQLQNDGKTNKKITWTCIVRRK